MNPATRIPDDCATPTTTTGRARFAVCVLACLFGPLQSGLSSSARADDLDIYTKALTSGVSGSPVLVFQIDNSGSMTQSVSTTNQATSVVDQRLYRMVDVAMSQVTGMKSTFQIGVTAYAPGNTGQLLQKALPLETTSGSAPAAGGTSVFPVVDENDDVSQSYAQGVITGAGALPLGASPESRAGMTVSVPYAGAWPSTSYPMSTYGLPAPTGSAGQAYGLEAGLTGNVVIWYTHGSTSNTQVFKVTGATVDSYLMLTDASGNVLRQTSTKAEQTSGDCGTVASLDTCISYSMTKNTTYRIVIGTDATNQTGTFSFSLGYTSRAAAGNGVQLETLPPEMPARVGLRFRRLDIPRGATISSAYIEFKPSSGGVTTGGTWRAGIDSGASPAELATGLFGRTVDWSAPQTLNIWSSNSPGASTQVGVTTQLQNLVNQGGWCGGDVTMLVESLPFYSGSTATSAVRAAYAFDSVWTSSSAAPAKLVVNWVAPAATPAGSSCTTATIARRASNVSDDVQQAASGVMTFDGTSLTLSATQKVGLRFPLLRLPPGVAISDARLELTPVSGAAQTIRIHAIDADTAGAFSGKSNALDSLSTVVDPVTGSDTVNWTPSSWTAGTAVQSENLAGLLQQVVNRAGWRYDNAIGLVLEGSTNSGTVFAPWEQTVTGANSTDRTQYGRYAARLILTVSSTTALPIQYTQRWTLFNLFKAMPAINNTPIMGTYIESAQYMLGWDNFAGQMPPLSSGDCATNGIVILTDGEENGSYGSTQVTAAKNISGKICSTSSTNAIWQCVYDMASALYTKRNTHQDGKQYSIRTDAIGFGPLAAVSTGIAGVEGKGGGKFYSAADSAALSNAFHDIVANMSISTASVAAAGVAVNALNRFEHLDQLYYSLFTPSTKVDWNGNMKRYRLQNSAVVDVNNVGAIDLVNTGFFMPNAQSYWSGFVDGSTIGVGGTAGKTPDANRVLYTYTGNAYPTSPTALADQVTSTNTNITDHGLGLDRLPSWAVAGGLDTAAKKQARHNQVVDYLRAAPVTDTTLRWGSAIHNSPRVVTYKTDPTNPVITVFYGDNRGFVHAVDAGEPSSDTASVNLANTGGTELFAFIPKELLQNAALLQENSRQVATDGYIYGMDGHTNVYTEDSNGDGNVDRALLFTGMRRGGSNYFALDVTHARRDVPAASRTPTLQWVIEGGTGDFTEMGQSWSALVSAAIRVGNATKAVLVFGGGYDPQYHDDGVFNSSTGVAYTNANQKGRVLYMVDRDTGKLVWKSSQLSSLQFPALANMKYSITATPRLLDRNSDGYVDAIYVVDLAGQVFRFEINPNPATINDLVTNVVLVATLGATAPLADPVIDNRRFYDSPSVARSDSDIVLALVSGYREEPRSNTTKEAVFFVHDVGAYTGPSTPKTLTLSDLQNLTGTATNTGTTNGTGWYLYLDQTQAEKGVGSPVIFNYAVLFSAWKSANADFQCTPDIGQTSLYVMDFSGAGLAVDANNDGLPDRFVNINLPGIGDTPQILFQADNRLAVAVGTRVLDATTQLCNDASKCPFNEAGWASWHRSRWFLVDQ